LFRVRLGIALLLVLATAFAQDAEQLTRRFLDQQQEAFAYYNRKEYGKAVAAFERQLATFADNPTPYYNIACCYALQGDAERAGTWLTLSITRGWRDADHLAQDPDFDSVRQSPEYIACLARLKRARDVDPDPMPTALAPGSVPPAPSISYAIAASQLEEAMVRDMRVLYDTHRFRKSLFDVLDRRMAVLARYIIENGDALDAPDASVARVGTAALYMAEGSLEADRALREAGAEYVLRTAEEFLRGYPGDPRLAQVLLARVAALEALGRDAEAIALLRTVRADHAAQATRAEVELCVLLPPGDELKQVYGGLKAHADEGLMKLQRARLMRARLFCEGMPDLLDLDAAAAARIAAHEGLVAYVFVSKGDSESERVLKGMPEANARFLPVVVCVDENGNPGPWLKENARSFPTIAHGAAAIERVWLRSVPTVVVAGKDRTVVAIDPSAAELARLATG